MFRELEGMFADVDAVFEDARASNLVLGKSTFAEPEGMFADVEAMFEDGDSPFLRVQLRVILLGSIGQSMSSFRPVRRSSCMAPTIQ